MEYSTSSSTPRSTVSRSPSGSRAPARRGCPPARTGTGSPCGSAGSRTASTTSASGLHGDAAAPVAHEGDLAAVHPEVLDQDPPQCRHDAGLAGDPGVEAVEVVAHGGRRRPRPPRRRTSTSGSPTGRGRPRRAPRSRPRRAPRCSSTAGCSRAPWGPASRATQTTSTPGGCCDRQDVRGGRHLEEGRADGVVAGSSLEDRSRSPAPRSRRRRAAAGAPYPGRTRCRRSAVPVAARSRPPGPRPRRGRPRRSPVPGRRGRRRGPRCRRPAGCPRPRRARHGPCRCACGRAPRPGAPATCRTRSRRRPRRTAAARRAAREDQLDPLVVERAVDAELGQRRATQLDPDEGRREPVDAHHLDLVEDHRQGVLGRSVMQVRLSLT